MLNRLLNNTTAVGFAQWVFCY